MGKIECVRSTGDGGDGEGKGREKPMADGVGSVFMYSVLGGVVMLMAPVVFDPSARIFSNRSTRLPGQHAVVCGMYVTVTIFFLFSFCFHSFFSFIL
ncbi:hypothetical protein V8C37DRAFT_370922 [Trichoderma ceciliae]